METNAHAVYLVQVSLHAQQDLPICRPMCNVCRFMKAAHRHFSTQRVARPDMHYWCAQAHQGMRQMEPNSLPPCQWADEVSGLTLLQHSAKGINYRLPIVAASFLHSTVTGQAPKKVLINTDGTGWQKPQSGPDSAVTLVKVMCCEHCTVYWAYSVAVCITDIQQTKAAVVMLV